MGLLFQFLQQEIAVMTWIVTFAHSPLFLLFEIENKAKADW